MLALDVIVTEWHRLLVLEVPAITATLARAQADKNYIRLRSREFY